MEALLEKEGTVESWNDERLDELNGRVNSGFKEIREEMRQGFAEINARLDRVPTREEIDQRFDAVGERFTETDSRFNRLEAQLDRVNSRLDYMLIAMFIAGLGIFGNLLADKL
jgi:chromosome segregation ATPase